MIHRISKWEFLWFVTELVSCLVYSESVSYSDIPHLKAEGHYGSDFNVQFSRTWIKIYQQWYYNENRTQNCNADNSNSHVLNENLSQKYTNIIFFYIFTSFLVKKGVKLKTGFSIRCKYSITVAGKQKLLNETSG